MTPYEYHNDQLGVKISYLIEDRFADELSIRVIKYRALRARMDRDSCREKELRRGCLNNSGLIYYSSIEQPWKDALSLKFGPPQEHIRKSLFQENYCLDTEAYNFYIGYTYGADKRKLDLLLVDEYTYNASVLNAVGKVKALRTQLRNSKGGGKMDIWETLMTEVSNFTDVPHTLPIASLRRVYTEYKRNGYVSLISGRLQNQNAQKTNRNTVKLLNSLFVSQPHKPTPTEIARQYDAFLAGYAEIYNPDTGELFNPKNFPKLSDKTITNYLSTWENKIGTHTKRSGDRQSLMQKFKPYHSLEQPKLAGSIISIDDRQPPFEYAPSKRLWFYNGIDLASECFTVFVHGKTKEGLIMDFYRSLVRNYTEWGLNLPMELEAEMSLNSQYKDTFLREGVMFPYVRIEANNARGKRIEAYYRPLRYGLEKKREGWLARPFAKSESNQRGSQQVPTIPYNDIVAGCMQDIMTWNNMPHSKHPHMSRWEYFQKNQNPDCPPTNWRGILPHIGKRTTTSCNAGIIRLQGGEYLLGDNGSICFGDDLIAKMRRAEGQTLDIYWLDGHDGRILKAHIYDGTEYIGEAIAKPRYNKARAEQTESDQMSRELMSKYVASVEGFRRQQAQAVETVGIIDRSSLTISNKFTIPGINKFTATLQAPEVIDEINEEDKPAQRSGTAWNNPWKL